MKILLTIYEEIISFLALLFFNNNAKKTVESLLEASISNNNNLILNAKSISVPDLITHAKSCVPIKLEKYMGHDNPIKQDFKSNFYLLTPELQIALLELLEKIKLKYHYFYGTSLNLSAYFPPNTDGRGLLGFYINISGCVGKKSTYNYIDTLHNYHAQLKFTNKTLPNTTIIISKWEHLKNRTDVLPSLYDDMLNILSYSANTDCFEANVDDLKVILQKI